MENLALSRLKQNPFLTIGWRNLTDFQLNEADTCRKYVEPRLTEAGWDDEPHSFTEQQSLTDGRIVVMGDRPRRKTKKRADYILRYTRDFKIAVVEAKARYKSPGEGLQQAKDYAEMLGLKFAYATNGEGIIEFDYITGKESLLHAFPSPQEPWDRYCRARKIDDEQVKKRLLAPYYHTPGKAPRYYQEIAINQSIESILQGRKRTLLTMATGTGKTFVAFQICWKLWEASWNAKGEKRRPRILYLADRNILIDDPKDKTFTPFGEARWKIENADAVKSREMYFAIYQSLAKDERRPGLFREYQPDFFDLIIVDECHRGSARDESNWREILEYFDPAYQLGIKRGFSEFSIVRLPNGVFAPYTNIPTNLLFFDRSGPTKEVWYYELPLPEGRKQYTKTKPLQFEEFADCLAWWKDRAEGERAWRVPAEQIAGNGYNLDIKNPNGKKDLVQLPPEELVESIIKKPSMNP